jgi:hypothetical protein
MAGDPVTDIGTLRELSITRNAYDPQPVSLGRATVLPANPSWQDSAACKGAQLHQFFPRADEDTVAESLDRMYCRQCPVRVQCLATALKKKDHGIFAGTSTAQRKKLARSRTRAKCPVCSCETLITVDEHDICTACASSWRTDRRPGRHNARDDDDR